LFGFYKPCTAVIVPPFVFLSWTVYAKGYSGYIPLDILVSMYRFVMSQSFVSGPCLVALAWHQWMPGHAQIGPDTFRGTIFRFISNGSVIGKAVYWCDSSICKGPFTVTMATSFLLMPKSDNYEYQNANLVLGLGSCIILEIPTPLSKR